MCGLVGMTIKADNGFTQNELNLAIMMLFLNQIRGRDSTGVVGVTNYGSRYWAKEVGGLESLMKSKNWTDWEKTTFQKGKLFFGHGRAATRGKVTIGNSHPFDVEKRGGKKKTITLVHNGTLEDVQILDGKDKFEVDSHWMANCIADLGAEVALEKIRGAIATIWWDEDEQTLNFYRNFERPLFFVQDSLGQILLNSEKDSLIYFKHKFSLPYDVDQIKEIPVNTIHTLDFSDLTKIETKKISPVYAGVSYTPSRWNKYTGSYVRGAKAYGEEDDEDTAYSHWRNDRTYEEDIKFLQKKQLKSVVFEKIHDGWWRTTSYTNGTVIKTKTDPYIPGLLKMYMSGETVKMDYEEGNTGMVLPSNDVDLFSPEIIRKSGAGAVTKFRRILMGGKSVSGRIQNQHSSPFRPLSYTTNIGENIKVSDIVVVEIADIQDTSIKGTSKCVGFRVNDNPDQTIQCFFYSTLPEKTLLETTFFEGVVDGLEVTSKQEFKENNSLVTASLSNVRPLPSQGAPNALLQ